MFCLLFENKCVYLQRLLTKIGAGRKPCTAKRLLFSDLIFYICRITSSSLKYKYIFTSYFLLASLSLLYNKGSCDSNSKRTAFAPCSLYAFLIYLTRLPALHVDFRSVGNESRMMSYVCPTFLPVPLRNCISWPLSAATLHM